MSHPKVSIVMATYNRAHLVGRAIESVRRQTFAGWELIITDDASTDATLTVLREWREKDPRIVIVSGEENVGIARNSNRALRVARGEYVAIIDDDDAWLDDEKLAKQVQFLDTHPEYVGVGGGMVVVNREGKELLRYLKPETDEAIRTKILFDNPMANSTTMFRLAEARAAGYYDETLRYAADRDFWLNMGTRGKLYNFPEYFGTYTLAGQNISTRRMREHLASSFRVMRRYKNNYPQYPLAFVMNAIQYGYAFVPSWVKNILHPLLFRLKRVLFR